MIVVDASVLIAHLDDRDALHERALEALLDTSEQPLACSSITLAEVLVGPARRGVLDAARNAITELAITEIRLGDDAAARLATMRAETNLKLPDCCVLLAAEDAGASRILTFDERLAKVAAECL